MRLNRLFHISEEPGITVFEPRPSPSSIENVKSDVVFAISDKLLHNYLLPRDCPRVTFYSKHDTTHQDKVKYFGESAADFVVVVEHKWIPAIKNTMLYCYEFPVGTFVLLDESAGYHISYESVVPLSVHPIHNVFEEFHIRNVEVRMMENLWNLAQDVSKSTLEYSLIRMRNAIKKV